ncbi:MAG: division/cell wall cluster transcriptional repressor MraZ [Melioribacteraceae bacterium]|nr:division/cell wall cluster transcriptional repressor MraZ [Melioribacteraceae bacterium]MCF8354515.1 division/cell wall cluster transcriptional repressor MraZ [Melioribacteraceae bacterium]MCF8394284.1 division/cell wall cluster transcriptional repressor MraZ [Melioribacteraceae bacterium]MCF8418184.1 division/cell wall cluster transcriptional repressor MraZ [Melioribacteraceae bacterium]
MFIGSFKYSVDTKGRVSIPAKLRKYLSPEANDSFVMTRGTEKCIDLYPFDGWKELVAKKLNELNTFDPKEATFIRLFLQEAAEDKLDSQSRLLIPKNLLEFADIKREVFILGAIKKIEIWNPEIYDNYLKENNVSYIDIAKEVMKM